MSHEHPERCSPGRGNSRCKVAETGPGGHISKMPKVYLRLSGCRKGAAGTQVSEVVGDLQAVEWGWASVQACGGPVQAAGQGPAVV